MRTDGVWKDGSNAFEAGSISILIVGGICHVDGELRM